jgi:TRAP-type C4-dicarboxylate transport system permease large subunit
VGTNLFAVVSIANEPIEKISREIIPFAIASGVVVLALAVMPRLVTWLPHMLIK